MADLKPYVIRQGDYLTKLAFVHGFDAGEVWKDARNDELRGVRASMDMLAPGDVVHLPDTPREALPISAGTTNRYVAKVPRVEVNLVFKNTDGTPLEEEPYEVQGLGDQPGDPKTGKDGRVSLKVPVTVREVTIAFPRMHLAQIIHVGDMDPDVEDSGVKHRLQNLGYWRAELELEEDELLRIALSGFQQAKQLPVTGTLDEDTRKALLQEHGL